MEWNFRVNGNRDDSRWKKRSEIEERGFFIRSFLSEKIDLEYRRSTAAIDFAVSLTIARYFYSRRS